MASSTAAPADVICYVQTSGGSPTPYTAIQSVTSTGGLTPTYASASSTIEVVAPNAAQLTCVANQSFYTTTGVPVQISATRIDGLTTAPLVSLGRPITAKKVLGK